MPELSWQLRKGPEGAPYAYAAFNRAEKRTNFFDKAEDLRGFLMKRGASAEDAVAWGVSGPSLRGSGVNWDIRKAMPYSCYDHFDFNVPLGTNGALQLAAFSTLVASAALLARRVPR